MLATRRINISYKRLLTALRDEGCELVFCQPRLIVVKLPGWDSLLAPALRAQAFSVALWDRFEITPTLDGSSDQHDFKLTYFTNANLVVHTAIFAFTLIAAAGAQPPGTAELLLFLLVSSLVLPLAAVYQAHVFFQKIQNSHCD